MPREKSDISAISGRFGHTTGHSSFRNDPEPAGIPAKQEKDAKLVTELYNQRASFLLNDKTFEDQFTKPTAVPESRSKVSATVGAPPRPNLSPGPWVHYKFGRVYELMHLALNEGTGEWMVVHRNQMTMDIFVRPVSEWLEIVQTTAGTLLPRFREPDRSTARTD